MLKRFESELKTADNHSLFYQTWKPESESTSGWAIITHGQGEHSDCYQRLVETLDPLNLCVLAWDLRGHGRSDGQRGYAENFSQYVEDFYHFYTQVVVPTTSDSKRVWIGHSMGGLIQLMGLSLLKDNTKELQILSNPYLDLAFQVPLIKDVGAIFLKNYLPKVTLYNEIRNEDLSRDPLVLKEYLQDTLRHHKISSGVYMGAKQFQQKLFDQAHRIQGPVFMQIAEQDPIVSSPRNKSFFELLIHPDNQIKIYSQRKHELYNDLDREEVFHDLKAWLKTFLVE
jgi:lysophospholipase